MQRLSTQLAPTAPTCQPSNRCRTAALTSLGLTLSSFPLTQFCAKQAILDDTDAYVAAAVLWEQLAGMHCIKRKQETIFCRGLVAYKKAECIVRLHCMTGCDVSSGFYGKGKKSVYDQVAKNPVARWQLLWCGESLDLEEVVVEHDMSSTATTRVAP